MGLGRALGAFGVRVAWMTGAVEAVLPLAIDAMGIGTAVGLVSRAPGRLLRHGVLLAGVAVLMPLLGAAAAPGIRCLAARANAVAIAQLFGVGIVALLGSERGWTTGREMQLVLLVGFAVSTSREAAARRIAARLRPVTYRLTAVDAG